MTYPDLMTVGHVANFFGKSKNTIWRWARDVSGFPEARKISGSTYWRKADIEQFVQNKFGGLSGGLGDA